MAPPAASEHPPLLHKVPVSSASSLLQTSLASGCRTPCSASEQTSASPHPELSPKARLSWFPNQGRPRKAQVVGEV